MVDGKKERQDKDAKQSASKKTRVPPPQDLHVAGALRTAYEEAVRETIPAEFLDLLGKLS